MSYLITEDLTSMKVDVFMPYNALSYPIMDLDAPASLNTDVTASSNSLTLYSGSSYYIEATVQANNGAGNPAGACTYQLYNATSNSFIGSDAHEDLTSTTGAPLRQGRKCATALILDSDINVSMTVQLRITALTGSGWDFDVYGWLNLGYGSVHAGVPSLRVWQLPS